MDHTTYVAAAGRRSEVDPHPQRTDQVDAARRARLIRELGFRGAAFFLHGTDHLAA